MNSPCKYAFRFMLKPGENKNTHKRAHKREQIIENTRSKTRDQKITRWKTKLSATGVVATTTHPKTRQQQ